ncbi:MAG: glutathione peroxidase [Pseudotabrizicola sp.]|uniref:glutathione peroxidase n=1 Tax=Pseudotabrizicola sp. TaxID=2939647 RepID=UPI00271AC737|nr:glutathione peroxidase [Pseudotabrizicola sp.]MDO9637866.1 glutathione peroxidase [Pseudotabrizicola sp.]
MHRRAVLRGCLAGFGVLATGAGAATPPAASGFSFVSIDGGRIALDDWAGGPVLVVNTASLCGFAGQFDDLQALHDRYSGRGLLVLAVPSDDFNQELADAQAVKEYCALRFDLTLPMTDITHVRGPKAHAFYQWLAAEHGFTPGWNFNKVLIGPAGEVLGTWGAAVKPTSAAITGRIEPLLR